MAVDANLALQASVTKTATFNGAGLTIATGTPRRGLKARVIYSAASTSSGAGSVTFGIDMSRDGGSTWATIAEFEPVTLSTTAASGEIFTSFEVNKDTSASNDLQFRLSIEAISGTGATVTYQGDLTLQRP